MLKQGHVEKIVHNTLMLIKFSKQIANSSAKITNGWRFLEVIRSKFKSSEVEFSPRCRKWL